MTARLTDWGLAALVTVLIVTGVLTLFAGSPHAAWVLDVHDACSATLAILLVVKLRRVWPRIASRARRDGRTVASLVVSTLAITCLISGVLWSFGLVIAPGGYSLLSWHDTLGAILVIVMAVHMVQRAKRLRRHDLAGRRQFLTAAGIGAASFAAWRVQRPLLSLVGLRGAGRRFTGSYEAASFTGNAFPTTSWVADNPRPLDAAGYRLEVSGLVSRRLTLSLAEIPLKDELVATLDCTGGFYSTQVWRGVQLGRLLDLAGLDADARHVSVASVTGYRWGFGLEQARTLVLASAVGGQPLDHGHGAPLRLVVPGARGFEWVKWVTRVEVRSQPDYFAPASTVLSSFPAV